MVYSHCTPFNGITSKICASGGITTTPICKTAPNKKAPNRYLFSKNPHFENTFFTFYIKAVD